MHRPNMHSESKRVSEKDKLNKLLTAYKEENEKCSYKI